MTALGRGMAHIVEDEETAREAQASNPLEALVGAVGVPGVSVRPARVSWVHLRDRTLDQGATNSCVGCSFSTCCYLRARIVGRPIPRPSQKLFYDLSRLAGGDQEMHDVGCLPLLAVQASSARGIVAEADWPLFTDDPGLLALAPVINGRRKAWIDTPPDLAVFHQAIDARVVGYSRADDGDSVAQLEAALAIGHIPCFGMVIPKDYGDVRGDQVYDIATDADLSDLGAHMQAIVGYDEVAFLIDSSWGEEHGDRGIVRVAKSILRRRDVSFARTVVHTVPARLAA